jgi:hypothetical protein
MKKGHVLVAVAPLEGLSHSVAADGAVLGMRVVVVVVHLAGPGRGQEILGEVEGVREEGLLHCAAGCQEGRVSSGGQRRHHGVEGYHEGQRQKSTEHPRPHWAERKSQA